MANRRIVPAVLKQLQLYGGDARGLAGVEFALTGLMLTVGVLNAVDVGYYIYQRMEVETAAEAGAQSAWNVCKDQSSMLPATQNCPNLVTAITSAIQSTTLGTSVSLASGYPTEAYYCVNASNVLQNVGSVSSTKPANCSAAGNATATPSDYIQVQATLPYQPLFANVTVMGALGISSIAKTSWMRMG